MCTTNTTHPADHPIATAVARFEPTEILDPYPDTVTNNQGVRQPNRPQPTTALTGPPAQAAATQTFLAASFQPPATTARRMRYPIASTVLNLAGQTVLGASIASGTVDPTIGAVAACGWMICGLALIAAQWKQINGRHRTKPTGPTTNDTTAQATASDVHWLESTRRAEAAGVAEGQSRMAAGAAVGGVEPLGNTELLLLPTETTEEVAKW